MADLQMPTYQSQSKVKALKIRSINERHKDAEIFFDDARFDALTVGKDYLARHHPHAGGYYVLYDDGYHSFCPADKFEERHVTIDNPDRVCVHDDPPQPAAPLETESRPFDGTSDSYPYLPDDYDDE